MRLTFRHEAGPHERYAPGAWDNAVGHLVSVPSGGQGQIIEAEVVEDGAAVLLTVEADSPELRRLEREMLGGLSIGPDS